MRLVALPRRLSVRARKDAGLRRAGGTESWLLEEVCKVAHEVRLVTLPRRMVGAGHEVHICVVSARFGIYFPGEVRYVHACFLWGDIFHDVYAEPNLRGSA